MAKTSSRVLTDHDEIRKWAEERNAAPACVRRTGGNGDVGMIRLDFPGYTGEQSLEHIDWEEWFNKFDESNLALLVQDQLASGGRSNFNKLVGRETAERRAEGDYRASRHEGQRSSSGGSSRRASSAASSTRSSSRGSASSRQSSGSRRGSQRSASASGRPASARAKRASASSERGDRSARTRRASNGRTKSSGASSRRRTSGGTASRSKTQRGSQRARKGITRRSGTVVGSNRNRTGAGSRQASARNAGRRSAKRNPEKIVKSARRIKQGADNIIRMERGGGSRGPSRVTKRASAKSASGTARQSRSRNNARTRRKAA